MRGVLCEGGERWRISRHDIPVHEYFLGYCLFLVFLRDVFGEKRGVDAKNDGTTGGTTVIPSYQYTSCGSTVVVELWYPRYCIQQDSSTSSIHKT